jgi:hypothetical protein
LKTLAKDVEDRYQNAIDLHDDLQAFMYTAGEFYSRKDLAAWMKKTFSTEIEEETRKLEEYRSIAPPEPRPQKPTSQPSRPPGRPATNPPPLPPPAAAMSVRAPTLKPTLMGMSGHGQMEMGAAVSAGGGVRPVPANAGHEWDDEELETQIYDKPDGPAAKGPNGTGEVAVEDPSKPVSLARPVAMPAIEFAPTQAPALRRTPIPISPASSGSIRLPGLDPQPVVADVPRFPTQPIGVPVPAAAFGARLEPRKSVFLPIAILSGVLLLCVGAVVGFWVWTNRPGSISVNSFPSDVQVFIDDVLVAKEAPVTIEKPRGLYAVTVQREGYEPRHENIEVQAGKLVELRADLVPLSGDLGFVLDSEPPGQKAFLDGQPLTGVTPLKVSRITAGKHNVEIRGAACYTPWTQEFLAEPGKQPAKLHALLKATAITAQIKSEPAGAKAFVIEGGRRSFAGSTPSSVKLDPAKKYAVALQHTGYKETTQDIRFDGSCELVVDVSLDKIAPSASLPPDTASPKVELSKAPKEHSPKVAKLPKEFAEAPDVAPPREKPRAAPAPVGNGFLKVGSRPWTKVSVDGEDKGNTPQDKIQLPAGKHKLVLSNPQFGINHAQSIEIAPNETTTVIKKFEVPEKPE